MYISGSPNAFMEVTAYQHLNDDSPGGAWSGSVQTENVFSPVRQADCKILF